MKPLDVAKAAYEGYRAHSCLQVSGEMSPAAWDDLGEETQKRYLDEVEACEKGEAVPPATQDPWRFMVRTLIKALLTAVGNSGH